MAKLLVLVSLFVLSAYSVGIMAAQDAQACKKRCADQMQQCASKSFMGMSSSKSMGMGMSNSPPDTKKVETKCADGKRACDRACGIDTGASARKPQPAAGMSNRTWPVPSTFNAPHGGDARRPRSAW